MEIEIGKSKNKRTRTPHFEVEVVFMEGDADGEQVEKLTFKEDETEDLKRFILALECCNAAYPNGRGGCDEYNGLPEYDAFFGENVPDLDNYRHLAPENTSDKDLQKIVDALMKEMNPSGIMCEHPSDSNYMSTSFDGYKVSFVDANGDKQKVSFKFSKEEQRRIKECETFFDNE